MSKVVIHCDYESRSAVDLRKTGVQVYANHPTTDALCMAYSFDNGPVYIWILGDPFPTELKSAIDDGAVLAAHNSSFEFYMWNFCCVKKYDWPKIPVQDFDCTMVRSYSMGLPGKLENAAAATGLKAQKDMKGHRVMLQLCKPRSGPEEHCPACRGKGVAYLGPNTITCECVKWYDKKDYPEKYEILYRYCKQDIFVERELDKRILPLSESERQLWHLDQKINHRGVYVDLPSIKKAMQIVTKEKARLDIEMRNVTKNKVATCNANVALKNWINSFDIYKGARYKSDGPKSELKGEEGKLKWYAGDLKIVQGVGKDIMLDLLEMDLPKNVRKAVLIRQEAAKSATAKLEAMVKGASPDSRVRGCFQFYGAASTGRWAGRRIQLHNMPRPTIEQSDIEEIMHKFTGYGSIDDLSDWINIFHGAPMTRIADCLRAMIKAAPGHRLISCDFSAIEGRVLAWLAGEESILNIFRSHGKIYEFTASQIYNVHIDSITKDDPRRLIGKVATLALGFQGGVGAFQSMAKNYFIKIPDKQADEIKIAWRGRNQNIVKYWYDVERAAIAAVNQPGEKFLVGPRGRKVTFLKKGSFLFCRLPSGRAICYPYPKMREVDTPWGEKKWALTYKGEENYKFVTKVAYGGLIAENITQSVARDLLAEALFRVEEKNYPVVMHIHDEIVTEVKENFGTVEELAQTMCELPHWAKDLPVDASGWVGERFRK